MLKWPHESQHAWVAKQHGIGDHLKSMTDWGRRRGGDCGVEFAEGFRHYKHQPYPRSPALEGLLGEAVAEVKGWSVESRKN